MSYSSQLLSNSRSSPRGTEERYSKENTITKNDTLEHSSQSQREDLQDYHYPKPQKLLALEAKINSISKAQADLENKFSKVVENLCNEIGKKTETNYQLQKQIEALQLTLQQSKQDMQIIKAFLKRQQSKENLNCSNKRKTVLNQTVSKLQKSGTQNHIFTDITLQSLVASKSISPRVKLLKRQLSG